MTLDISMSKASSEKLSLSRSPRLHFSCTLGFSLWPTFKRVSAAMFLAGTFFFLVSVSAAARINGRQATSTKATPASASGSFASTTVPDYFQISPAIFQGATATGSAPFLAETNPAPFAATNTFTANTPLETSEPISGSTGNVSIFELMGNLSPYFPNPYPQGLGANEYPLPAGANISQVHMISRHGSRYPTSSSSQASLAKTIQDATASGAKFSGQLSFLNSWKYLLGAEILVPKGRQELFDSGILHYYQYGSLYNPNTTIVARTTTQSRMRESAEYFLAGFFGLNWEQNPQVKLEFIIELSNFNNSLASSNACNNSNGAVSNTGSTAQNAWAATYLANATQRFNSMSTGFNWTVSEVYAAQELCPYETVGLGYSQFCNLFTYPEYQGLSYSFDLEFAGNNLFQSPTGRAVGVGYVQELLGRLQQHYVTAANTTDNVTLDSMPSTFPLNQSLYFDFSHDTNIASIVTALGFSQFATYLPPSGPPANHTVPLVSSLVPFAGRMDIEIITTPQPVAANRPFNCTTGNSTGCYTSGSTTKYVHVLLNQRTLPLGASHAACGNRADGWCELSTFIAWQQSNLALADFDYACNANYSVVPYGQITNGAPIS